MHLLITKTVFAYNDPVPRGCLLCDLIKLGVKLACYMHLELQKIFHSALTLLDDSGLNAVLFESDLEDVEKEVSCVSRQLYPDGSAIFETMARTSVTVVAGSRYTIVIRQVVA